MIILTTTFVLLWIIIRDPEDKKILNITQDMKLTEKVQNLEPSRQTSKRPAIVQRNKNFSKVEAKEPQFVSGNIKPEGNETTKAPDGTVPFKRIGEYVVAYGDILLGRPTNKDFPATGFIEAPKMNLWENSTIPFSIHNTLTEPERVLRTIEYFNENTPIQFVPFNGQQDSIVFVPIDDLCLSYLGKIGGHQPIYLSKKCAEREIAHEIMHALGMIHEQSRPDRDRYLQVLWQNIEPGREDQFVISPDSLFEPIKDRPFDFRSVMLYPPEAFAKQPGLMTLQPLGQAIDPVSSGLSPEDTSRLWMLYNK